MRFFIYCDFEKSYVRLNRLTCIINDYKHERFVDCHKLVMIIMSNF